MLIGADDVVLRGGVSRGAVVSVNRDCIDSNPPYFAWVYELVDEATVASAPLPLTCVGGTGDDFDAAEDASCFAL